ncbi:MAG: glycosyltransferase family 9 protein, partial [Candidatus Zixiibacteriota bacterium]
MGTPIRLPDTGDGLRILVCRTDALGEVILSTPVFRALRSELPNAHITALCREYTAPVLMGNPSIDEVITTPDGSRASCDSLIRSLKTNSQGPPFDIAIVLYPSEFAVSLVYKLRIPLRVGTAGRWRSWKFTHRV